MNRDRSFLARYSELRYNECVEKGRLKRIEPGQRATDLMQRSANELGHARRSLERSDWSEALEAAYYAMTHAAEAALDAHGVQRTNFFSLCLGVWYWLVRADAIDEQTLLDLDAAKSSVDILRSRSQSPRVPSRDARLLVDVAEQFLFAVRQHINVVGGTASDG